VYHVLENERINEKWNVEYFLDTRFIFVVSKRMEVPMLLFSEMKKLKVNLIAIIHRNFLLGISILHISNTFYLREHRNCIYVNLHAIIQFLHCRYASLLPCVIPRYNRALWSNCRILCRCMIITARGIKIAFSDVSVIVNKTPRRASKSATFYK